jgi:signal transduction histidine kinase
MVGPDRELLAVVVHELRSPVAALVALAAASKRASSEATVRREHVRLALAACHGIARTVSDANVASVRLARVDIAEVVEDAVAAARLEGADARAEIEPGLPPVGGDAQRLRQVLDNLIGNATTHADDASPIVVRARLEGGRVLVSVSDRGVGIAPSEQARIFESGVRLETSRPGSGLGLAVVRSIVVAHGGELSVESAPGGGATFTIELPAAR